MCLTDSVCTVNVNMMLMIQDKTNVYCNYDSQEAGLAKHRLHKMNTIGI